MSMHKKPLTPLEEEGLRLHHLDIGIPSQLSDSFRNGMAWAQRNSEQNLPIRKANTDKLAELALYCVQRKIGHAGQKTHKAIMLHCDALAAQVDILRDAINYSGAYKSCQDLCDALIKTPKQCLAEVKAEAVKAFADEIGVFSSEYGDQGYVEVAKWKVQEHIAKVRQGGE